MEKIIYNPLTDERETVEVEETLIPLEEIKLIKQNQVLESYKQAIVKGMTSSSTGVDVLYGYSQQDQLNYSKWANALALDPSKTTVTIGSISHGVLLLTREQFLQFSKDCEKHEMNLYMKRVGLQNKIKNATTIEELESIPIMME